MNTLLDPATGLIDYTRASWSRASWSNAADAPAGELEPRLVEPRELEPRELERDAGVLLGLRAGELEPRLLEPRRAGAAPPGAARAGAPTGCRRRICRPTDIGQIDAEIAAAKQSCSAAAGPDRPDPGELEPRELEPRELELQLRQVVTNVG